MLADWIDLMPDGTFPNINLVEGVLNCIDSLQMDTDYLEGTNLGQVVQYYAEGIAKMPQVKKLAMQILDKWSRIIYKINTQYDPEGKYDINYRELQRKLGAIRERHDEKREEDAEDEDDGGEDN